MPDYEERIRVLEIENEALRARVGELLDAIGVANTENYGLYFDLTPQESVCFGVPLKNHTPRRSAFKAALYSDRADDKVEPKIIDVYICKLRKKLKPHRIEIKTQWGEAYYMPEASKARARELIAGR